MELQCNDWNPVIFILENYHREGVARGDLLLYGKWTALSEYIDCMQWIAATSAPATSSQWQECVVIARAESRWRSTVCLKVNRTFSAYLPQRNGKPSFSPDQLTNQLNWYLNIINYSCFRHEVIHSLLSFSFFSVGFWTIHHPSSTLFRQGVDERSQF